MKNSVTKYNMGWIGFRAAKVGRASRLLTKMGAIRTGHAELNNRNAFDFTIPVRTRAQFDSMDFRPLAEAGFEGIAIWITDAQWGKNAATTDLQWQRRAIIERDFTAAWANGRRDA